MEIPIRVMNVQKLKEIAFLKYAVQRKEYDKLEALVPRTCLTIPAEVLKERLFLYPLPEFV